MQGRRFRQVALAMGWLAGSPEAEWQLGIGFCCECYTHREMYARKLAAEMTIGAERRPVPLDWLDSFCMRNFTGSAEFDDTLPRADGRVEAGLSVDPERLAAAMSEWFTKRGKGNGVAVVVELCEVAKEG